MSEMIKEATKKSFKKEIVFLLLGLAFSALSITILSYMFTLQYSSKTLSNIRFFIRVFLACISILSIVMIAHSSLTICRKILFDKKKILPSISTLFINILLTSGIYTFLKEFYDFVPSFFDLEGYSLSYAMITNFIFYFVISFAFGTVLFTIYGIYHVGRSFFTINQA